MNPPLTPVDGETESRDVVWAAGHAGAVGEGWQGRGDCAVAGDNETRCCSVLVEFLKGINSPGYTEQEGRGGRTEARRASVATVRWHAVRAVSCWRLVVL